MRWDESCLGFGADFAPRFRRGLRGALRQRDADYCLVRIHVVDARDADGRKRDDVQGVDADARTDVARGRGVVHRHVGRDDGSDDVAVVVPHAVALSPGRR